MYLGELGLQVFIQSEKSFKEINFIGSYEVDEEKYFHKGQETKNKANENYEKLKRANVKDDIYIIDLMRGDVDEEKIPRIKIK